MLEEDTFLEPPPLEEVFSQLEERFSSHAPPFLPSIAVFEKG